MGIEEFSVIENERLQQQLNFIVEVDKIKQIMRRTKLIDGTRFENDAEHSWHLAIMAMLLKEHAANQNFNLARVMKMVVIHDLIEIYAGDTFAYDVKGNADKAERERKSADKLFALLPSDQGKEIRELWEEFDKEETQDARYAAALDHLQPFVHNIFTDGCTWKNGNISTAPVLKRMAITMKEIPGLKPWIEYEVEKAVKNGWLQP